MRFLDKRGNVETIFDVGANTGEYTRMLGSYFPDARIHCFEPAGATFSILADNMRDNGNVVLNNFGISDERGKVFYTMTWRRQVWQVYIKDNWIISR